MDHFKDPMKDLQIKIINHNQVFLQEFLKVCLHQYTIISKYILIHSKNNDLYYIHKDILHLMYIKNHD